MQLTGIRSGGKGTYDQQKSELLQIEKQSNKRKVFKHESFITQREG